MVATKNDRHHPDYLFIIGCFWYQTKTIQLFLIRRLNGSRYKDKVDHFLKIFLLSCSLVPIWLYSALCSLLAFVAIRRYIMKREYQQLIGSSISIYLVALLCCAHTQLQQTDSSKKLCYSGHFTENKKKVRLQNIYPHWLIMYLQVCNKYLYAVDVVFVIRFPVYTVHHAPN